MDILSMAQFLERILTDSYRTNNIPYMDWNAVDWHLRAGKHEAISGLLSTHDNTYGFITWEGYKFEFLYEEKFKRFIIEHVKLIKVDDRHVGLIGEQNDKG